MLERPKSRAFREAPLLEILGGDLVHPVLELIHDLVFGGVFYRLLEDDAGLLYYLVGGEDLGPRADGEGYGVRWPGVYHHRLALYLEPYGGEKGRVPELGHRDALHRAAELVDEVQGEVVRQWPDELLVLKLEQNRAGLGLADPDRQVTVLVFDLEDYDRAGGKEVHVHAVNGHLGEAVGAHWLYAPLTPRGCGVLSFWPILLPASLVFNQVVSSLPVLYIIPAAQICCADHLGPVAQPVRALL